MILITDDNSLHILGFVEGVDWKHYQYTRRSNQQGFFWLQQEYISLKAEYEAGEMNIADDPMSTSQMILYGAGGYSRYRIRATGEIVLLADTTRAEKVEAAKALEITVVT